MKKRRYVIITLVFVFFIVACLLPIVRRGSQQCSIDSLVVDEGKMPEGWENKWTILPPALDALGAQEAYSIFMHNGNETASYAVFQYSNRWLATFHVWFDNEVFFPSVGWEWSELEGASSLPLNADQIQIKCGDSSLLHLDDRCTAVLRYGPYISNFSSSTQLGVMSTEEFKKVLLKIDDVFSSCVK